MTRRPPLSGSLGRWKVTYSWATRLGVSPRTYAGYVADLKDEFDAETRFQLGYSLGQLGLRGDGTDPADDT